MIFFLILGIELQIYVGELVHIGIKVKFLVSIILEKFIFYRNISIKLRLKIICVSMCA